MININKMSDVIVDYKEYFPKHWKNEKYKWIAVKHFRDNWDIDAPDFAVMLQGALAKTENAKTEDEVFPEGKPFVIGNNSIGAKTLDLNQDFELISQQLDRITVDCFI